MAAKEILNFDESILQFYLDATKNFLDIELQNLTPTIRELRLHRQIEYALQTSGKHLRSAIVLLSGESVGGSRGQLQKLALAVELLHSASLVHDDILDREVFRRNSLSVQAKWSVKEAILVGDALASLALGLCRGYGDQILDVMACACVQLSDGEYMDVTSSGGLLTEEDYIEKARKKTGALFKAAAECGAIASGGSAEEVDALAGFGEKFGLAFQIRDDILDVSALEKESALDFCELSGSLPIVHMCEVAGCDAGALLSKVGAANRGSVDRKLLLGEVSVELENCGSLRYCSDRINFYVNEAITSLAA
ncbi:MAG TPA: polyprenyl synthetase family protein, partial [Candidatus Nanoarchaeia archaeon]|nr:polyprenyl synthetase family protein [Candidatus Nanoarchaeia archaeon]